MEAMSYAAHQHSDDPRPTWAGLPVERVLAAYRDGVVSLSRLGAKVVEWGVRTPCPQWTLLDIGGHVLAIARYWHRLLNAALTGEPCTGLPRGAELAMMNGFDLRALPERRGPARFLAFEAVATRYGERLADVQWSTPLGEWQGLGAMTVGDHTLAAVGEWHLHAWDVARSFGWTYRPDDPDVVLAGIRELGEPDPGADPWSVALIASGRRA